MAAIKEYNWPDLFKRFESSNLTQRQWCLDNNMNETNTAREFAALRRERAEKNIEKARMILSGAAPLAASKVREQIDSEDESISQKASFGILGAVGLSAQVAAIQINNKTDVNILAVPIFANAYTESLDGFLGAQKVVDADTESNS